MAKRAISGLLLVLIVVASARSVAASSAAQPIPPHWQLSGWYSPGFWDNTVPNGQYAPTGYRHGHCFYDGGGPPEYVFGSIMDWTQARADNVRYYSNNLRFWWCDLVYMYYTHDHTDMSGKLNGVGAGTNMPNPTFDRDDDAPADGRYEEYEVVSVNQSFPQSSPFFYSFVSYYEKQVSGPGYLLETPALSAKPWCMSEYNTWRYDDHPQRLDYNDVELGMVLDRDTDSVAQTQSNLYPISPVSGTISAGPIQLHTVTDYRVPRILVGAAYPVSTRSDLDAYVDFVKSGLMTPLRHEDVNNVLTIVTFNEPVSRKVLEEILGLSDASQIEMIKAVYSDVNDPNPATNTWTLEAHPEGNSNYTDGLSTLASSISSMELMPNREEAADTLGEVPSSPRLELIGFVAIELWLPLEQIDYLNKHEMIFLADPLPTYARMLVSYTDEAVRIRSMNDDLHQLPDGIEAFIIADFTDLYSEMQFLSQER